MKTSGEILKDPRAKMKKTVLAVLVGSIGVLTLVVFSAFGWLLRDFLVFDANRIQAKRELSSLNNDIVAANISFKKRQAEIEELVKESKIRLQKLADEIAGREAMIAQQQERIDESTKLVTQITQAKSEREKIWNELKKVQESVASENGRLSELKNENEMFERQKKDLVIAVEEHTRIEREIKGLKAQIDQLTKIKGDLQTDVAKQEELRLGLKAQIDQLTSQMKNLNKASESSRTTVTPKQSTGR
jgi:chromosome segregation ATPase